MADPNDYEFRLFENVKLKYGALLGEFQADDDLIDGKFRNVVPATWSDESTQVIAPPTANDAIQNAADHILSVPRISVPVRPVATDKIEAEKVAERRQQFHTMWWDNVFSYCGDPFGRAKVPLIKGKVVLKKCLKWDLIPVLPDDPTRAEKDKFRRQLEKAGRNSFLWELELLPKETVFEDLERPWDPRYVFESYQISYLEAVRRYPQLKEEYGDEADLTTRVDYVEYWSKPEGKSRGKFIQWVNGVRVHEGDNPYSWEHALAAEGEERYDGYVPYIIGDPGWGDQRPDCKPEDRYVSMLRPLRSSLDAECRLDTMMMEYLKLYIWKPLVGKNIPEGLSMAPGAVWSLQEGQEVEFLQPGEMPVSLLQGLARIHQYVDQTAKLGQLGGVAQRGVDTATEADMNARNATTKLSGPIRTLRRMAIKINEQVAQDIEKVLEAPVTLYGAVGYGGGQVVLKPTDIDGFYMTSVEMETSDEAALNLRNARTWSDLAQRMPISFKTVMRMAGIQNGSTEMEERTLENLEQSPQVMQALLMMLLQGIGETGQTVNDSMRMQLMNPGGASSGASPSQAPQMPNMPANNVEAMRQQTQQAATQAMPERSMM